MSSKKSTWQSILQNPVLEPQEALLKRERKGEKLIIGIPKERSLQEARLCLTPTSVEMLCAAGQVVWLEQNAGAHAKYSDESYQLAGAKIVPTAEEVFKAHIILKVEPPTLKEIACMQSGSILISALQVGYQTSEYIHALNQKKITAIAFELFQDELNLHAIQRAMSEIAGSMVLFIAAEYLSTSSGGMGIVLGGIPGLPPTRIVLLGAGTVAEHAARVALGLGADVHVFDTSIHKLRRMRQRLGQTIFTSLIDHEMLSMSLAQADVLIGAIAPNPGHKRFYVTEEMVMRMKKRAVIIDVSIDHGGCIDTSEMTTHTSPIFYKHDVIHYCVPNITSRASRTATLSLSNILTAELLELGEQPNLRDYTSRRPHFIHGIYAYRGYLTNLSLAKRFNIDYKDINLLLF